MKKFAIIITCILISCFKYASGGIFYWTGNSDNVFSNADNWDGGGVVPGANDTIIIDNLPTYPVLDADVSVYCIQMLANSLFDLDTFSLTIQGYADMQGGKMMNGEFVIRGESAIFNGTEFTSTLNVQANYIDLSYGTFSNICYFEFTGSGNSMSFGMCTFSETVSIVSTGTGEWHLGSNQFDNDVFFIVASQGSLYLSDNGETYYNGNIYLNNTGSAPIIFGNEGGASYLADGMVIAVGDSGYMDADLYLTSILQTGIQSQSLDLSGDANLFIQACQFYGSVFFTSSSILCSGSIFHGDARIVKTGSESNFWAGSNYFYGSASISNNSPANADNVLNLSSSAGNIFYGDAEFICPDNSLVVDYATHSEFNGDLHVGSDRVSFLKSVFFKGDQNQIISGNAPVAFEKMTIHKSSNSITADTTVQIIDSLIFIRGNINSTGEHLVIIKAGASVSGASDSSFVSGPVKKVGNTSFDFPVGKGTYYGQIGITASDSITDSFTAEFFDYPQAISGYVDSTVLIVNNRIHYSLIRNSGSSLVKIRLHWNENIYGHGRDSSNIKLLYYNGTKWIPFVIDSIYRINSSICLSPLNSWTNYNQLICLVNLGNYEQTKKNFYF